MAQINFRSSVLPALQCFLTTLSTCLGVTLVILWRPNRTRKLPFYSDATHNDPERILLACGENLACMCTPLVAIAEYLHHTRLLNVSNQISVCHIPILRLRVRTRVLVMCNFVVTLFTTCFFFVTANVPSKHPATFVHQTAASALILFYALQATCKLLLAHAFKNYTSHMQDAEKVHMDTSCDIETTSFKCRRASWWDTHHLKLRLLIALALWTALLGTWVCYMGRVLLKHAGREAIRRTLSQIMAGLVHVATFSCLVLMAITSIDLRGELFVFSTRKV